MPFPRRLASLPISRSSVSSMLACAALLVCACGKKAPPPSVDEAAAALVETTSGPLADAGIAAQNDAGPSGPRVYAIVSPAPVFNITEWPARDPSKTNDDRKSAQLVGYLRKGD